MSSCIFRESHMPSNFEQRAPSGVQARGPDLRIAETAPPFIQQHRRHAANLAVGQAASAVIPVQDPPIALIHRKLAAGAGPFHSVAVGHFPFHELSRRQSAMSAPDQCREL